MAMGSGRFFGWVIGGTLPAALTADWPVSAWDQHAGMRFATPATAAIEEAAGEWLLEMLGLPRGCDVGFTTGATMANFVGLLAGRQQLLTNAGWDLDRNGLTGAPRVQVLVGEQRHDVIDLALRYLGLGAPIVVPADGAGRLRADALAEALDAHRGPSLVCLQAGNLHSGAFDPIGEATAIVSQPEASRAALGVHTSYLVADDHGPGDPPEKVPELSRRARGIHVWAALRSLGRSSR